jgi:hypothetical protein
VGRILLPLQCSRYGKRALAIATGEVLAEGRGRRGLVAVEQGGCPAEKQGHLPVPRLDRGGEAAS